MFATRPARRTVRRIAERTTAVGARDHAKNRQTSVRTKRMARSLTAMVVAAGSVAALAGPAQAYDKGTCNDRFGAANVDEVDIVRLDTGQVGEVDFGDDLHLFGAPQGNAVVCWQHNGKVAVVGRLYADPWPSNGFVSASAQIKYYNYTNPALNASTAWGVTSTNGLKKISIDHAPAAGYVDRVRIRLYNGTTLVHSSNRFRGD